MGVKHEGEKRDSLYIASLIMQTVSPIVTNGCYILSVSKVAAEHCTSAGL